MPNRVWRIDSVIAVAWATVRQAGYTWLDATSERGGTAGYVRDMFAGKAPMPTITEADVTKAWKIMNDLAERDRLTNADKALRAFLTDCGRKGGVSLADVARVSVAAAYGLNGMGKRYPRRDAWESYAGSQWQGTPGRHWEPAEPLYITITYTNDLKARQGTTTGGRFYRYLGRLYRGVDDAGNVYKWIERQRSRATWHDLTLGDRVILHGGMVDLHDSFTSKSGVTVRMTEFTENGATLDITWYDARIA